MQNGKLVWEQDGSRFVAVKRDRRNAHKCYGCCFSFRPEWARKCPSDCERNRLCEFGHGYIWITIRQPRREEPRTEKQEAPGVAAEQMMLLKEDML